MNFIFVLPAFTCASTIGNFLSICLGVDILRRLPWFGFYFTCKTFCLPLTSLCTLS